MPLLKPPRGTQLNKAHPLARGLVGCWLFNEGSGGKVFDSSGNQNMGTLYADTSWATGKFGHALNFDGSGDYVGIPNSSSLDSITNQISVGLWVYPRATNDVRIAIVQSPWQGYWIDIEDGNYRAGTGSLNLNGGTAQANKRSHLMLVYNGNVAKFYVDGVEKDSAPETGNVAVGAYVFIGCQGGTFRYWDGLIDDVKLYNRALSAAEIAHLYREPFCMFDLPIEPGLLYPAGQVVWLTAASTATSSVYGSLTKQSKLAGIIDAAAALSAILTWHYRGQVERQWLIEALFNAMTANAFKLGTVLTGGWFWMRWTGCSALYRGPSMEQIDFANILTVAEQDAGSISPPDYLPHHSNSTYFYVVRRFNICGYQERTLAAAVKVAIDADGNLIEPKPNNIFAWRLDQVYGNKIQLIWFYCPLEQESKPESFRIYYDGGTGLVDYENPIATINYQGRKFYTYQSDALTAGRYLFAVRAEDAAGVENNSLAQLPIQLATQSPDSIEILSVQNI